MCVQGGGRGVEDCSPIQDHDSGFPPTVYWVSETLPKDPFRRESPLSGLGGAQQNQSPIVEVKGVINV